MNRETEIEKYFDRLYPINRSITGEGNRKTLKILQEIIDLKIKEVSSGTKCHDWKIPYEWNIKEAWVKNSKGEKIIDFEENNLHILGYSIPFLGKMNLSELKEHLYSVPEMVDAIPYLTSYYKERWGFCLTHKQLMSLKEDEYEIYIDSSLNQKGSMTYGEAYLKGKSKKEILFSTYICHPSLASDNLSGPLVSTFIYEELKKRKLKYSYRFIFIPETVGSIYYLSKHGKKLKSNLAAGFVITTIGDNGLYTYKKTRDGNTLADRAAELVLEQSEKEYNLEDFFPTGSDERQFCSPGFNLPIGSLMRTRYGKYPQYHTSLDNKDYISFNAMAKSVEKYLDLIELIEGNDSYINNYPYGEPQLGKRGLYPTLGSQKNKEELIDAMLWVLNFSDGKHDIIEIAKKSKINYKILLEAAALLHTKKVIKRGNK